MGVADDLTVIQIAEGMYRVAQGGRANIVYVAGPPGGEWAFWNGRLFLPTFGAARSGTRARPDAPQHLTAPMPAVVRRILVTPGAAVKKGQTLIVLEAMKMELALRAAADGVIAAVHCRENDLVQPDLVLIDFE